MVGFLTLINLIGIVSFLARMAPNMVGVTQNRAFNYHGPPARGPATNSVYSCRAYVTDVSLWVVLTDLQPRQQSAATSCV
eukprot:9161113-Lingulodinium_polyedra.AAC.1